MCTLVPYVAMHFFLPPLFKDLTGGGFEQNLTSMGLQEGLGFYHFSWLALSAHARTTFVITLVMSVPPFSILIPSSMQWWTINEFSNLASEDLLGDSSCQIIALHHNDISMICSSHCTDLYPGLYPWAEVLVHVCMLSWWCNARKLIFYVHVARENSMQELVTEGKREET